MRPRPDELEGRTEWTQFLYFQEGSAKGFAAFMVWVNILLIMQDNDEMIGNNLDEVTVLTTSLAKINCILEAVAAGGTQADSMVLAIARQNSAARVTPVTSYQWACILKQMGDNLTFDQAPCA